MIKLTLSTFVFLSTVAGAWTSFRSVVAAPAEAARTAAVNPLSTEAAYRHRNALPTHWRGYVLQQRRY